MEVVEHALEDLAASYGRKKGFCPDGPEIVTAEASEKFLAVEAGALLERVNESGILGSAVANDEVARESDTVAFEADALRNLHVDQRERDRDSNASADDFIEETVSRIRVVLGVAAKVAYAEELVVDCVSERIGVWTVTGIGANFFCDDIEARSGSVKVGFRIAETRDQHRRAEEVDFVIGSRYCGGKRGIVFASHYTSIRWGT
jgi:hypothetical protein